MGVMSGFGKYFVNRLNEYTSGKAFEAVRDALVLPTNSAILELGAGKGGLSYLLYNHYKPARVVVTDYDASQVEEAKAFFEGKFGTIPPKIEFRVADALKMPFEDESFDAVFAMSVLHHLETHEWQFKNIPTGLEELRRVLKTGGSFVYGETFKKDEIRKTLEEKEFVKVLATRYWMINDFCIYTKTWR